MSPFDRLKAEVAALGDSASPELKTLVAQREVLARDAATVLKARQATERKERLGADTP